MTRYYLGGRDLVSIIYMYILVYMYIYIAYRPRVVYTLSSKNLSPSGIVNSNSHVTSDPDTGGTNLTDVDTKDKHKQHTRTHTHD